MRYPVERTKYNKIVGKTRVENIAKILREFGFTVETEEPENHDVDVWVSKDGKLVLVIEVLNWRKMDYMDFDRLQSIVKNLGNPKYKNVAKLLIYSFDSNIKNRMDHLVNRDIGFLEIGFQTQPQDFYTFYGDQVAAFCGMKPDGEETKRVLREKLLVYLKSIGLL
jgi:hypothetical protein